ncbi:general transcription factor 3C polypeptide 5 [Galleria mellonella]|uniref:General transcription factor 3C polypeptide 5 n=1 Tax=Galleria mellonella TaxID=7137 RepID=A0A6J1WQ68_GALME|nr:general transcription factor 3C polypeptide 5 [Galleria mellonella]
METDNSNRELVCIQFPGIVKNNEKALRCLGGIKNISQVYSHPTKKRLGLCFQPDNPYVKKIYADEKPTAGVVIKVRVKKTIENNEVKREVMSTAIVGRVSKIFKFESMCDFQYLPVEEKPGSSQGQCVLEKLLPTGLEDTGFMSEPSQLFIVPSHFTRSDKPVGYMYTDKRYQEKKAITDNEDNLHYRLRLERGMPTAGVPFNLIDNLPTEPQEFYVKQKIERLSTYPALQNEYDLVQKLFDERPIWSMNLVKYHSKVRTPSLKIILPCLAFYMKSGPWKMLWVKYGYDPRKDPAARMYQSLDFRVRHTVGIHSVVLTREHAQYKRADRVRSKHKHRNISDTSANEEITEATVYFRPGVPPSQRQVYYQLCDIKLPEVEELLAKEPPPGYLCHPKRGWLPPKGEETCRDHMFEYLKQMVISNYSADVKFEQGSSDEDNSEDEGSSAIGTEVDEAQ